MCRVQYLVMVSPVSMMSSTMMTCLPFNALTLHPVMVTLPVEFSPSYDFTL